MKIHWSFPIQVLITLLVIGSAASIPIIRYGTSDVIEGAIVGALLATINVLLGYAAIAYAFNKSTTTFFKVVVGGMGIRLLLMAVALVFAIKAYKLNVIALTCALGVFYAAYLVLEILYIHKKVDSKH
jgi:Ca2+/H+ antiporter